MFYVYNPVSYKRLLKQNGDPICVESERAAKAQLTKSGVSKEDWKVITTREYYDNEPYVTVNNLLSGKPVQIRISERGSCCDPSTERYHCM